jgi:hypothetical protein
LRKAPIWLQTLQDWQGLLASVLKKKKTKKRGSCFLSVRDFELSIKTPKQHTKFDKKTRVMRSNSALSTALASTATTKHQEVRFVSHMMRQGDLWGLRMMTLPRPECTSAGTVSLPAGWTARYCITSRHVLNKNWSWHIMPSIVASACDFCLWRGGMMMSKDNPLDALKIVINFSTQTIHKKLSSSGIQILWFHRQTHRQTQRQTQRGRQTEVPQIVILWCLKSHILWNWRERSGTTRRKHLTSKRIQMLMASNWETERDSLKMHCSWKDQEGKILEFKERDSTFWDQTLHVLHFSIL